LLRLFQKEPKQTETSCNKPETGLQQTATKILLFVASLFQTPSLQQGQVYFFRLQPG
jgi:hypothetical protein